MLMHSSGNYLLIGYVIYACTWKEIKLPFEYKYQNIYMDDNVIFKNEEFIKIAYLMFAIQRFFTQIHSRQGIPILFTVCCSRSNTNEIIE